MGLIEFQRALAALYTNAALRARFLAQPESCREELSLTDEEARRLAASAPQIEAFARSLLRKRLGEVGAMLPATRRALGPDYASFFLKYASAASPPPGVAEDAVRFARFLAAAGKEVPALALDLARYESAWIESSFSKRFLLIRRFRYPVHRLAHNIENPSEPPALYLGIWFRFSESAHLRHLWIRLPKGGKAPA